MSLMNDVLHILDALEVDHSAPNANQYGKLLANLALLKCNAIPGPEHDALWAAFIDHLTYPDHDPFPHALFRMPHEELIHLKLALEAVADIYGE
jgi:hypothetical protein